MYAEEFEYVLDKQLNKCKNMLSIKAMEYANNEDRLHNFNVAAEMQGIKPREALAGMMAKHTVSIYDLCREPYLASADIWDEKITDHINYLIILRAVVREEMMEGSASQFPDNTDTTLEDEVDPRNFVPQSN